MRSAISPRLAMSIFWIIKKELSPLEFCDAEPAGQPGSVIPGGEFGELG
jgi:hypothetical protein